MSKNFKIYVKKDGDTIINEVLLQGTFSAGDLTMGDGTTVIFYHT